MTRILLLKSTHLKHVHNFKTTIKMRRREYIICSEINQLSHWLLIFWLHLLLVFN